MALGLRELDLEAGLGFESICLDERNTNITLGGSSVGGNYVARLEKADEVRPLLQNHQENQEEQEHLIHSGIKHVTGKHKKINVKRPPKPPRPPKGPSLDAADLKLIRELSELALEKRMRIERMKDLKKMRAFKAAPASSSYNSSVALIVTVLFCLIILYQGVCSSSGSVMSLESSPGPVLSPNGEELISIQVFKDLSPSNHGNERSSETEPSSTPAVVEVLARDAG